MIDKVIAILAEKYNQAQTGLNKARAIQSEMVAEYYLGRLDVLGQVLREVAELESPEE